MRLTVRRHPSGRGLTCSSYQLKVSKIKSHGSSQPWSYAALGATVRFKFAHGWLCAHIINNSSMFLVVCRKYNYLGRFITALLNNHGTHLHQSHRSHPHQGQVSDLHGQNLRQHSSSCITGSEPETWGLRRTMEKQGIVRAPCTSRCIASIMFCFVGTLWGSRALHPKRPSIACCCLHCLHTISVSGTKTSGYASTYQN
jgi:hypothetical protein